MELVTVRTFSNYFSANIMLSKLRDGGIRCYLKDEFTVTVDPILSNAVGGIKLIVNKDDESEVLEILNKFDEDYYRLSVCPKCGSHEIDLVPKQNVANMVTAFLSWLFSSYAVSAENVYKCSICGYESNTLPEALNIDKQPFEPGNLN
jgi:DNA-directed RNA polymerase subunit RPC12/RpoP